MAKYTAIPDNASDDASDSHPPSPRFYPDRPGITLRYHTLAVLILTNIVSICAVVLVLQRPVQTYTDLLRQTSAPSPLFDHIPITLHDTWFNHTLYATNASIFTQRPSPQVDAAWERYGSEYTVPFTSDEIFLAGKDPSVVVKYPPEWSLKRNARSNPDSNPNTTSPSSSPSMTMLEVFHQIHCLNSMRRAANYNHYYRSKLGDTPPDFFWTHLGHCQWVLLQSIMCSADVGLITFNWVQDEPYPFPDFNTQHKCRDFNSILEWQEQHQVDLTKGDWANLKRPDDAVVLDAKGRSKPW